MLSTPVPFEPVEFYHLAWWLYSVKPASSEQSLKRTIIGRAYYAALLAASDKTGTSTAGQASHISVINAVQSIDSNAANNLRAMKELRRKADYLRPDVNERDVQKSLRDAKNVLELLGYLPPGASACSKDYLDKSKFVVPCFSAPTNPSPGPTTLT